MEHGEGSQLFQNVREIKVAMLIIVIVLFSFLTEPLLVKADQSTLHAYTNDSIPSGIAKDNFIDTTDQKTNTIFRPLTYIVNNPQYPGTTMNSNTFPNGVSNSLVMPVNNVLSGNPTNTNTGVFGLWSISNHQSALWSNDNDKMNLDKDQYFSFWFWGDDSDVLSHASTGGLAFVIQNDPRQQNAFSYSNAGGTITDMKNIEFAPDETFGAFAADQNSPHLGNAIKNSWALSLDMHPNTTGKINDSFDEGVYNGIPNGTGNVYISAGYPGEASTYNQGIVNGGYVMPRSHVDVGNMSYANGVGLWHHLRILYSAPSNGGNDADVTYWFDDLNEDGSQNTNTGDDAIGTQANPKMISRTYPLDLSKLNAEKNADGERLVRWGLTARDDSNITKMKAVLENASPVVNVKITPQVIDVTQDNRVLTPENEYVNSNDKLIFRYIMKYVDGVNEWSKIKSFITIPDGTNLNTSDYGTITYGNSTESITNPKYSNGYFQYELTKALGPTESSTSSKSATMDVNTTAQAADNTEVKVDGVENFFNGDYYIGHSKTQNFIIRGKQVKNLQLTTTSDSTIQVATGGNVELNGVLKYDNDTAFISPGAEVYLNVNGDAKEAINVPISSSDDNKSLDISAAISNELTTEFNNGKLNSGDNTVTVYARDSYGNKSNTLTFTIKVMDKTANLILNSEGYAFNSIQASQSGLIQRKGAWKINVYAVNSGWKLEASGTSLKNGDSTFDGEMVYKTDDSVLPMVDQVPISSSAEVDGASTTVIGENWPTNAGILLKSNGKTATAGKYTGVINWDLIQGP